MGADGDGRELRLVMMPMRRPPRRPREMPRPSCAAKPLASMPLTFGVGDDEDLAVGEDAVYVEDEDFDVFGAGFSGHSMMITCVLMYTGVPSNWPPGVSKDFGLVAPVTFNPDIAATAVNPSGQDPAGMGVRGLRHSIRGPRRTGGRPSGDSRHARPSRGARGVGGGRLRRDAVGEGRSGRQPGLVRCLQQVKARRRQLGGISSSCISFVVLVPDVLNLKTRSRGDELLRRCRRLFY